VNIKTIRVLLVEDSPDDVALVTRELQAGAYYPDICCVQTPEDLRIALAAGPWDVVISDYRLPHLDAPAALTIVRQSGVDVPFIVLTGTIGEDRAAAIMKAGAHDFVLKHQLARLNSAIEREIRDRRHRSDHHSAVIQLRTTNQELSALVNASPLAIITLNQHLVVQRWNPAASTIFGWSALDMQGQILAVPLTCHAEFTAMTTSVMSGASFSSVEMRWLRSDGSPVDVSFSLAPLRSGEMDNVDGIILMASDMTERKRLEAHLHQTQKVEIVGKLAGGIAHDFNNLLTVINGRSQRILTLVKEEGAVRRDAEIILDTGERAARLTRQLLAFSRRQIFQMKQVDINRAVTDMRKMLAPLIGEDIVLLTHLEPDLPPIWTDASQLEQVILNLAVNARDAMPTGGRLTITTSRASGTSVSLLGIPATGPFICLTVSDTGEGMNEHTLSHLFEPFFTTKRDGTGLGLSTVDSIVRQSGGCLKVSSVPGKGSSFNVYLPATTKAQDPEESSKFNLTATGPQRTVLIVEDNHDVREIIRETLSCHGYRVISAANWTQALAAVEARTSTIDLLLTDLIMPQVSGREVAARLQPLCPDMKVLYMSGYSEDTLGSRHGSLAGMPLLQKPFSPRKLLKEVNRVFKASPP